MIVALVTCIIVTAVILFLAGLTAEKLSPSPIPSAYIWLVWVIAIVLIVVAWWRLFLAPIMGPLP
jgi:hypothetical protein